MLRANGFALKEWAVVVRALTIGRQLVLLRKGGIADPDGSFRLEHSEFFLYPTFEHQHRKSVRKEFLPDFDAAIAEQPAEGKLTLSCYAEVAEILTTSDLDALRRLEPFHIWSQDFLEARLRYKPELPLRVVVVRGHSLRPVEIPVRAEYAGCKSWVKLEREYPIVRAAPAVDAAEFARRLEDIRAGLRSRAAPGPDPTA